MLETILLYCILLIASVSLINRKKHLLFPLFGVIALFLLVNACSVFRSRRQKVIAVYHTERTTAVGFIDGKKAWLAGDFVTADNQENVLYYVSNHFNRLRVREWNFITLEDPENDTEASVLKDPGEGLLTSGNFICFHGRKICLIDGIWPERHPEKQTYDLDYVIIRNNPEKNFASFFENFRVQQVVLDPSLSFYMEELMKEKCSEMGIPCYVVRTDGAWIQNLKGVR